MAEQEDRSRDDLTEEVSQFRLEEFRRRGQVAQSKELAGLLAMVGAGVALAALAPSMGDQIASYMSEVFRTDLSARMDLLGTHVLAGTLLKALKLMVLIALPVCAAGFVLGALSGYAQIGSVFSADPLTPDLNKINPLQGMKRYFKLQHLFESFRLLFKTFTIVLIAYFIAKSEIFGSPRYAAMEFSALLAGYGNAAKSMFFGLAAVLAVFAAFDFGLQRWEYHQKLRMTKQESKQEFKEREGDPLIKARIKSVQREMARRRMMQAVKKADVIVTNPTHIAVALMYEKDLMFAPKVVAKGADFLAQKIKKIASDAGVPMVENVPLARTLFKSVKVGGLVPRALYQAVAEVLAYVYRLKNRKL
ncbi:MAG: flagellar biosynthesis protein FlhB [Bdellovibrionales bacterium RIFOXYD1_FULL_53_11]|nr:MAG: flagellar biosynthesis protein FlhB [Bdellovibrionales bacterium RIFOXYD1_FULL_53_11]